MMFHHVNLREDNMPRIHIDEFPPYSPADQAKNEVDWDVAWSFVFRKERMHQVPIPPLPFKRGDTGIRLKGCSKANRVRARDSIITENRPIPAD
jgi:hypothetical protein